MKLFFASLCCFFGCFLAARFFGRRLALSTSSFSKTFELLLYADAFFVFLAIAIFRSPGFLSFAAFFLVFQGVLWGFSTYLENAYRAPAFASLALFFSVFLSSEWLLRTIPSSALPDEVVSVPKLYSPRLDRAAQIYRIKGFRGRKPATEDAQGAIRIFAMGGSSTWGVPLVNSREAYPAVLQTLFQERRPNDRFEVYNAGLAGMGSMQILQSISETVIRYHPQVVSISAWYNDSSRQSIWYGVSGKSDRDFFLSQKVLKWVQNLPVLSLFFETRVYSVLRHLLLKAKENFSSPGVQTKLTREDIPKNPRRMSPEEYGWALEEIAKLGEQHHFLPLFIYEPLNRTRSVEESFEENEYYRELKRVAEKYQVPVVDTLSSFHERIGDWLFYDVVHPNENGHRLMAETIYQTLTNREKLGPRGEKQLREAGVRWEN